MRENLEGSLCHLELAKALHMKFKKTPSDKKLNWNFTKLKYFMLQMTPSRKQKDNPQADKKYLQIMYQTKNLCLHKEFLIFNNKNRSY